MPSGSSFSKGFALVRLAPETQGLGYIDIRVRIFMDFRLNSMKCLDERLPFKLMNLKLSDTLYCVTGRRNRPSITSPVFRIVKRLVSSFDPLIRVLSDFILRDSH
jgi:hypothetical protein